MNYIRKGVEYFFDTYFKLEDDLPVNTNNTELINDNLTSKKVGQSSNQLNKLPLTEEIKIEEDFQSFKESPIKQLRKAPALKTSTENNVKKFSLNSISSESNPELFKESAVSVGMSQQSGKDITILEYAALNGVKPNEPTGQILKTEAFNTMNEDSRYNYYNYSSNTKRGLDYDDEEETGKYTKNKKSQLKLAFIKKR